MTKSQVVTTIQKLKIMDKLKELQAMAQKLRTSLRSITKKDRPDPGQQ